MATQYQTGDPSPLHFCVVWFVLVRLVVTDFFAVLDWDLYPGLEHTLIISRQQFNEYTIALLLDSIPKLLPLHGPSSCNILFDLISIIHVMLEHSLPGAPFYYKGWVIYYYCSGWLMTWEGPLPSPSHGPRPSLPVTTTLCFGFSLSVPSPCS